MDLEERNKIIGDAFDNGYNQAQQKYVPILKRLVEVWLNNVGDWDEEKEERQCSPVKEALELLEDAGISVPPINPRISDL